MTSSTASFRPSRAERRAEFARFHRTTYAAATAELLALTGDQDLAHAAAHTAYVRAWQAWSAVRVSDRPEVWVRVEAIRQLDRLLRSKRLPILCRPPTGRGDIDGVDAVLIDVLRRLPSGQRLLLVLHYIARLPEQTIVQWFGGTAVQVGTELDDGYAALVEMLDWPSCREHGWGECADTPGDFSLDGRYIWTAQALEQTAQRLRGRIRVPAPASVFRRAAAAGTVRRGLPVVGAAAALSAAVVITLSSSSTPVAAVGRSAMPPTAVVPPAAHVDPRPRSTAAPPPSDGLDATLGPTVRPAPEATTVRRVTATSRFGRSVSVAAGSALEQAIAVEAARAASPPR